MVIFIHPFFLQGSDSASIISAGLPDITGSVSGLRQVSISGGTGAFSAFKSAGLSSDGSGSWGYGGFNFDASLSNSIYGASTTVQPAALALIPQIKF